MVIHKNLITIATYQQKDIEKKYNELEAKRIGKVTHWFRTKYPFISALTFSILMLIYILLSKNESIGMGVVAFNYLVSLVLPFIWIDREILRKTSLAQAELSLQKSKGLL